MQAETDSTGYMAPAKPYGGYCCGVVPLYLHIKDLAISKKSSTFASMDKSLWEQMSDENKESIPKGEFTLDIIKSVYGEIFSENRSRRDIDYTPQLCSWEEDGVEYWCWKIGTAYTNDAGKALFDEALKKDLYGE